MNSNRCSDRPPEELAWLAAAVDDLAAQDLDGLTDAALAGQVLQLRCLLDRLEGQWLQQLAAVDARGAAGADQGTQAASTTSWLRNRLRLGAGAGTSLVRTARALFRGPLTGTAQALCDGELSVAHASVLAHGTHGLPTQVAAEAEPVLVEAARRLDPPRLRRAVAHLRLVADPETADRQRQRQHEQRWLWLAPTLDGMVAVDGLLEPEAGRILLAGLESLARPANGDDSRSGGQRRADALVELARRSLEQGQLPQTGGVRPQLTVIVDLDSLLGQDALGGDAGWAGSLAPEACRRLACDGALTRVLVTRSPTADLGNHDHDGDPGGRHGHQASSHRSNDDPRGAGAWRPGSGRRWPCCPQSWAAPPANRWMSGGPAGSSPRPTQRPGHPRRRLCVPRL
jgi:Domain of unknown function (DUF222)